VTFAAITRFPAAPESAREARQFVRATLATWGCADMVDSVSLLATELVTNAVLHAHSAVTFDLQLRDDVVRVEVGDQSERPPVPHRGPVDAVAGRGLAMVAAQSQAWGVDRIPGRGKRVWFEVKR
jgi:anti-sigma regulatory factor (Ser/Thr protein kinase)